MRIILEGADGTGKTTLAKILAEKYNLDICHCGVSDPCDYDFYKQSVRKDNIVWDRHTIGELIYPRVFERVPQLGTEDARLVISYAKELKTKIFVLTTDIEEIKRRLFVRGGEDQKIYDNLRWINDQFLFYANQYSIPIIDTSKLTMAEIFAMVEKQDNPYKFIHK